MARIEFRTTRSSRGRVRGARLFATAALAAITSVGTFASVAYGATVSHALTGHDSSTSCNSSKSGDLRAHDSGSATSCSLSASPTSPTTVNTPVTFTYQLNASEDGNAIGSSPVTYTIQGGATSVTGTATTTSTAYGLQATFSYTFGSAGSYTISATYQGTVDRLSVSNDSNGDQQSSSNSGNNGDDESGSDLTATINNYTVTNGSGTVTLYGDGGTYGSGSSSTYSCVLGSPTTPTVPSAPVGYSFAGWSVTPSNGGVDTTGPVSYTSSVTCATLTLYAVWTPVSVTVEITNIPSNAAYLGSFTPAYATSGNGTVFSATSATPAVCVVNGTTVNFVGVGSCTLIASVGATPTSPAATGSPQSFVVSPLTPTVSITNMPSSPKKGSSFVPAFITSGNGTVFSVTSNSAGCSVSGSTVSFVEDGPCSLVATVAATTDYTQATSVQTTQTTNAVAAGTPHFPMIVSQSGIGGVRSNVASLNLTRPGTTRGRFAAGKVVDLIATPKPGFLVNWSGACSGATTHCVVTVRNAEHVHVAFRAAVTLPVFYFATNMTNITLSPAQVTQLKHDLVTLARLRVTYLTIKAFADYRNGTVYNQALSQRRANSVTAFIDSLFPQLGLTPMRMINLGEGILRASNVLQFDRKAIVLYI